MARQIINETDVLDEGLKGFNANFAELYNATGGGYYIDNAVTSGSPLTVTSGNRSKITINNSTVIDNNIPVDFTSGMWDATNNKLLAVNNKDVFTIELRFKASSSVANGRLGIELEIPTNGIIRAETKSMHKTASTVDTFGIVMNYFTGANFIANGCEIYLKAIDGDITAYDFSILINRIHLGF